MSDPIDGKVLFQGAGLDPNNSKGANPEGTPAEDSGTGQNDSEPITRKEVLSLVEATKSEVLRQTQGLTDKVASRFDKVLAEKLEPVNVALAVMKENGVAVPPDMEMKMRRDAYDRALAESNGTSQSSTPGAEPKPGDNKTAAATEKWIEDESEAIIKKYGYEINEDDPEAKEIKFDNPHVFLTTLEKAAAAKAQRLGTPAVGRITSLGMGQSYTEDEETLGVQLAELQKEPLKNAKERKEVRAKLAALQKNKS